jgi:hypothetical protein
MEYEASEAEHGKPDTLKEGKELMIRNTNTYVDQLIESRGLNGLNGELIKHASLRTTLRLVSDEYGQL